MNEKIPVVPLKLMEKMRRKLRRRYASLILAAMAESDMSLADIAKRVRRTERFMRQALDSLIAGVHRKDDLEFLSDFFLAMGYETSFGIQANGELAIHSKKRPEAKPK